MRESRLCFLACHPHLRSPEAKRAPKLSSERARLPCGPSFPKRFWTCRRPVFPPDRAPTFLPAPLVAPVVQVAVSCFIHVRTPGPARRVSGDIAAHYLEHQLDPAKDRQCSPAGHGMGSGNPVSAGEQDARRTLPTRSIRNAWLPPDAGARDERLQRSRYSVADPIPIASDPRLVRPYRLPPCHGRVARWH